jgi:hypothetical protein
VKIVWEDDNAARVMIDNNVDYRCDHGEWHRENVERYGPWEDGQLW